MFVRLTTHLLHLEVDITASKMADTKSLPDSVKAPPLLQWILPRPQNPLNRSASAMPSFDVDFQSSDASPYPTTVSLPASPSPSITSSSKSSSSGLKALMSWKSDIPKFYISNTIAKLKNQPSLPKSTTRTSTTSSVSASSRTQRRAAFDVSDTHSEPAPTSNTTKAIRKDTPAYYHLGSLGPSHKNDPVWQEKFERQQRQRDFGKAVSNFNIRRLIASKSLKRNAGLLLASSLPSSQSEASLLIGEGTRNSSITTTNGSSIRGEGSQGAAQAKEAAAASDGGLTQAAEREREEEILRHVIAEDVLAATKLSLVTPRPPREKRT